jgi:hypothetical protein
VRARLEMPATEYRIVACEYPGKQVEDLSRSSACKSNVVRHPGTEPDPVASKCAATGGLENLNGQKLGFQESQCLIRERQQIASSHPTSLLSFSSGLLRSILGR